MTDDSLHVADLVDDFARSLAARRRSPKTIRAYTDAARKFATWAADNGAPTAVDAVERRHVEAFVIDQLEAHTPATAAAYYRHLQQFWRWVADEGEVPVSPMAGMSPPKVAERPVPVYGDDDLRALLKATDGVTFADRRDHAIIRMFIATGARLGEVAGMTVEALARDERAVLVIGKGDRGRWVPYGDRAAVALDRYVRMRRRHPLAHLDALWLGQRGPVTASGITQMLRRVGRAAGVDGVRPHRFRHTAAHRSLAAGVTEGDAMAVFGWRSDLMVKRYGASARDERARAAFRRAAAAIEGDA